MHLRIYESSEDDSVWHYIINDGQRNLISIKWDDEYPTDSDIFGIPNIEHVLQMVYDAGKRNEPLLITKHNVAEEDDSDNDSPIY